MNRYAAIRPVEKAAFSVYDMLWRIALPVLRKNRRLSVGFNNRILRSPLKGNADIWIQAASAGEAYLAWELLKSLPGPRRINTVLTTNTLQGKEILDLAVADINRHGRRIEAQVTYFPFDMPSLMARAVHRVRPRVMVLLETEIWPGLLLALKQHACPTVIVNGRMTLKSFSRYKIWPAVWPPIGPDRILAISKEDAGRFAALFGHSSVTTMPNIKFDRVQKTDDTENALGTFDSVVERGVDFAVLGSVRREEETDVQQILCDLNARQPDAVIGLFPRHLHRVPHWRDVLHRLDLSWELRSAITTPVKAGRVILWDVFGELNTAYQRASAAFVGGSLAPLGGQNFLEPLIAGVTPVIGPHWKNFAWIGAQIISRGLVHQADSWQDVSKCMATEMAHPEEKKTVISKAAAYIRKRQGGTKAACELIMEYLQ